MGGAAGRSHHKARLTKGQHRPCWSTDSKRYCSGPCSVCAIIRRSTCRSRKCHDVDCADARRNKETSPANDSMICDRRGSPSTQCTNVSRARARQHVVHRSHLEYGIFSQMEHLHWQHAMRTAAGDWPAPVLRACDEYEDGHARAMTERDTQLSLTRTRPARARLDDAYRISHVGPVDEGGEEYARLARDILGYGPRTTANGRRTACTREPDLTAGWPTCTRVTAPLKAACVPPSAATSPPDLRIRYITSSQIIRSDR